jgi:TonB family protein
LIVDAQGLPRNIKILSPLGAGLDEQAVAAVSRWKFKPAEQKGNGPVPVEIAIEVDFHRY